MHAPSLRERWWALVAGATLALLLGEVVVRQVYYVPWELDPDFGCIVLPGTTARYRIEGNGVSHWTVHGVRGVAVPDPARAPILVLGDSFTEAYQVDDDETFAHRLETGLGEAGWDVLVVNAGRSAASPADYVADAERNIRYFNPRWTVVQLNEDDLTGDAWSPEKTHFTGADGRLVANPAPARTQSTLARIAWRVRQTSALFNYGVIRFQQFARAADEAPPLFSATSGRPSRSSPAYTPEDIAAELDAVATAYRGRVTFLLLPTFDPDHPSNQTPTEEAYRSACAQHAWSCLSLRDGFERFAVERASPYGFPNSGFNVGHMNPRGHRLAAELLTRELRALHADALL